MVCGNRETGEEESQLRGEEEDTRLAVAIRRWEEGGSICGMFELGEGTLAEAHSVAALHKGELVLVSIENGKQLPPLFALPGGASED